MNRLPDAEPVVVASVLERDAETTGRRLGQAPAGCALVELRGDHLRGDELTGLVRRAKRPLIVTVRSREAGGRFSGSEDERRRLLEDALDAGARFVDVELGSACAALAQGRHADRVILSHHGGPCRAGELRDLLRRMAVTRAARLKLVPDARSVAEIGAVRELLDLARRDGLAVACFASGRPGTASRLLAPAWGSWGTYGSIAPGRETAPGQFTAAELLELYDVTRIGPDTRCFALVGSRVASSPSPAMHGAAYRAAGLDARYLPIETDAWEECPPLVGVDGVLGLAGLAVTMPFKERACDRCRELDPVARTSRAVNTVVLDARGWSGFNTDGPAALGLIAARGVEVSGARVAVVGAGGTARAIAAVVEEAGGRVTLFNRTVERGARAGALLGVASRPLGELERSAWDVLIQATPLGSRGEQLLPPDRLTGRLVLDAVYGRETPLIRAAREQGIARVDGDELLLAQATLQFERLTGVAPDAEVMRRAGAAWLARRRTGSAP